jgi:general secretion pathway protein J
VNKASGYKVLPGEQGGFTFIEVMVSVGIFAVIATICFATLSQYLRVREVVAANDLEMRQLQRMFTLIERDLRFMVNRPVRDEYGDTENAYISAGVSSDGELFRITVSEPDVSVPGSTRLRRIGWRLEDGELYRDSWAVLDRVQDTVPQSRLVLSRVSQIEVINYQWSDDLGVQQQFDLDGVNLPYATELLIDMDDESSYRRLFDLANGS